MVKESKKKTTKASEIVSELHKEASGSLDISTKLSKDLKKLAENISDDEVRYLLDMYYSMQEYRKALSNQELSAEKREGSNKVIEYFKDNTYTLEKQIKKCLEIYVNNHPVGQWLTAIKGVGPVISAGLIAYIDIDQCEYSGQIMKYAGMTPDTKWEKGQKRPYNAEFKSFLWNVAQCFIKNKSRGCEYGLLYDFRKTYEKLKNDNLEYKDIADVKKEQVGKSTIAYKEYNKGKLPEAHINARATRFMLKIFINHVHYVMYRHKFGKEPAKPYVHAYIGHGDLYVPKNLNMMGWNDYYGKDITKMVVDNKNMLTIPK